MVECYVAVTAVFPGASESTIYYFCCCNDMDPVLAPAIYHTNCVKRIVGNITRYCYNNANTTSRSYGRIFLE
jgi:hypothetical protein